MINNALLWEQVIVILLKPPHANDSIKFTTDKELLTKTNNDNDVMEHNSKYTISANEETMKT